ncbi:ead/Ea22-like family protein [Escherichia coli]|nr:ead/Ea22-like family protein [Escherichia coli]MDD8883024.1 ead/Ea22-like family protein [Escherichia coli]
MSEIDYQALRKAAQNYQSTLAWYQEKPDSPNAEQDCDAALAAFKREIRHREVDIIAGLLDELDEKQQYIKLRDQENEDIALTVGKLRVELEAAENNLIDSECHVAGLEEALRDKQALLEASEKRIAELEAELVSQTYKLNALSDNSPVTPDGWVMVPKKLTAENGAKDVLSGEFSETTFISCPECFGDDDCDTCDGSGRIEIKVPVTWATIKSIWDKSIEYFAAKPSQEVK